MLNGLRAVLVFHDPDQMGAATAALVEYGFRVRKLDESDVNNDTAIWVAVETITSLDHAGLLAWMNSAVRPFDGLVVEIETFGGKA